MIFCVFLDPQSVSKLSRMGGIGADALIGIFRVILGNCLLAETTDWRTGQELRDAVKAIENQDTRKLIFSLLEKLWELQRFVDILDVDEKDDDLTTAAVALRNRSHPCLDAIITETAGTLPSGKVEVTSVDRFHGSDFAARCQQAKFGLSLPRGVITSSDFFHKHLSRILLVEGRFEIYDSVIGREFGDNFYHNLPWWIDFLRQSKRDIELVIHTEGYQTGKIQDRLDGLCDDTQITPTVIRHGESSLPHERYLKTPAFTLNLGRGIDLFDPRTGTNRDLFLTFAPRVDLPAAPHS